MNLGIDIGNYNVKTSEGVIFKSAVSENIEYGNKFDKIEIDSKTYDVTFNDIRRRIRITDVQVFPESVSGIIAHFNSTLFDVKHKDIVSVDIGGKTTDIALIKNKKVIQSSQVNTGTIDIYNCIKNSLEAKYFDAKINLDDIKDYLEKGFYYKGERQNINFAIKSCNDLFKEVYTELNLNYPINTSAVVFQGGGMDLLNSVLSKKISNIIKIEDLFANARGYKSLLK